MPVAAKTSSCGTTAKVRSGTPLVRASRVGRAPVPGIVRVLVGVAFVAVPGRTLLAARRPVAELLGTRHVLALPGVVDAARVLVRRAAPATGGRQPRVGAGRPGARKAVADHARDDPRAGRTRVRAAVLPVPALPAGGLGP